MNLIRKSLSRQTQTSKRFPDAPLKKTRKKVTAAALFGVYTSVGNAGSAEPTDPGRRSNNGFIPSSFSKATRPPKRRPCAFLRAAEIQFLTVRNGRSFVLFMEAGDRHDRRRRPVGTRQSDTTTGESSGDPHPIVLATIGCGRFMMRRFGVPDDCQCSK